MIKALCFIFNHLLPRRGAQLAINRFYVATTAVVGDNTHVICNAPGNATAYVLNYTLYTVHMSIKALS